LDLVAGVESLAINATRQLMVVVWGVVVCLGAFPAAFKRAFTWKASCRRKTPYLVTSTLTIDCLSPNAV
jgi:hypothetical protein